MFQIQTITSDSQQQQTVILPDGSTLEIQMYYSANQYCWFFRNIQYGNFQLQGLQITTSPNMLYQFKNQIPIGLTCFSVSAGREPSQLQDFSSGLFGIYILTQAEVTAYTEFLQGGNP